MLAPLPLLLVALPALAAAGDADLPPPFRWDAPPAYEGVDMTPLASEGLSSKRASVPIRPRFDAPVIKPYTGPLKTKEVDGKLICDTPECAISAATLKESMNDTVDPCEDFFMYVCGRYLEEKPIGSSSFAEGAYLLDDRMLDLVSTPGRPEDPEPLEKMRNFYSACMDLDAMDKNGLKQLHDAIAANIGAVPLLEPSFDGASFSAEGALGHLRQIDTGYVLTTLILVDQYNTSHKELHLLVGRLGLNPIMLANSNDLSAYQTYMEGSFKLLRDYLGSTTTDEDIEFAAAEVLDFEVAMAKAMVGEARAGDTKAQTTVGALESTVAASSDAFSPLKYLNGVFGSVATEIVSEDELFVSPLTTNFLTKFTKLVESTNPSAIANYVAWVYLKEFGRMTTYAMRDVANAFQNQKDNFGESSVCVNQIYRKMPEILARAYVDSYFTPESKDEVTEIVDNLRASFSTLIDDNRWLADEDIPAAREKLEAIKQFVGYPEWIKDDEVFTAAFAEVEFEAEQYLNSDLSITFFHTRNKLANFRNERVSGFVFAPTTMNAAYSPTQNSITIAAGICQIPFYQPNTLASLNYGALGLVCGHELTHGFDSMGRNYDGDGNLAVWWSQASIDAFEERAQCFVDQYNSYHPPEVTDPSVHVDGENTLGENIADNGGLREAYRAYKFFQQQHGDEPKLPGFEEFTSEQMFYLGHARSWCESNTENGIINQIARDVHSPGRFRVLGPEANDDQFWRVWQCPVGSAMNRGTDRCLLW